MPGRGFVPGVRHRRSSPRFASGQPAPPCFRPSSRRFRGPARRPARRTAEGTRRETPRSGGPDREWQDAAGRTTPAWPRRLIAPFRWFAGPPVALATGARTPGSPATSLHLHWTRAERPWHSGPGPHPASRHRRPMSPAGASASPFLRAPPGRRSGRLAGNRALLRERIPVRVPFGSTVTSLLVASDADEHERAGTPQRRKVRPWRS